MTLTTVTPTIDRDRWGRPLIKPAGSGKPVPYQRATTVAGMLDSLHGLMGWKIRMAMIGLVDRSDLYLSAAAHRDDKKELDKIAEQALDAAQAGAAATVGTAVHSFCEQLDRGLDVKSVPDAYQPDLTAYAQATAPFTTLHIEEMLVLDAFKIAGTPDRIVTFRGENYIADIKTGSIDYPHKIAAQLAIYAHGHLYNHGTGDRTPLPAVNGQTGIIIHLPAGTGTCTLHWIDIAAGWDAVQLAIKVGAWRSRKDLMQPVPDEFDDAISNLQAAGLIDDPLLAQIQAATTRDELVTLYRNNKTVWNEQYNAAAATRQTAI